MDGLVREFVSNSVAPSTARVYSSAQNKYLSFCSRINSPPLPLQEHLLCRYVAFLVDSGLKHSSIKGYLSALRRMQIVGGMGDPFAVSWPLLECTLKGIKMQQAKNVDSRAKSRLPITPSLLCSLRCFWEKDRHDPDNIMLWAACCTCFFGFLRSGEVTVPSWKAYDAQCHLSTGDVMLVGSPPRAIEVAIKASKTDPFRKGVKVFLGRTDNHLCPVAAVAAYMAVRGNTSGPFFMLKNGRPLSRETLVRKLREALGSTGVDVSCYSGHSFRIGAATTAASVGIEDSLIKTLGRWESAAYLLYVRVPRDKLASVSKRLAGHSD